MPRFCRTKKLNPALINEGFDKNVVKVEERIVSVTRHYPGHLSDFRHI